MTTEYPMAEMCRANAARAAVRIRALHEARFGCPTWDAWSEPFRDADDRRRTVMKPVHGCQEHGIWITD